MLRDYQIDLKNKILTAWREHLSVLAVMATGGGKTNLFLDIVAEHLDADPRHRALIIAHRKELIDQPIERLCAIRPEWAMTLTDRPRIGVIQALRRRFDAQLTVGTVQSLNEQRTAELLRHGPITLLVTDEAHHVVAETYTRLIKQLTTANPDMLHLGVTATPLRADEAGLAEIFPVCAGVVSIADLVRKKYLVKPRWLGVAVKASLEKAGTKRDGDWTDEAIRKVLDTPAFRRLVVRTYQKHASDRKMIAFTATVEEAEYMADAFNAAGISAACVSGTTKPAERAQILHQFKIGDIRVVTNCDVLTEGFDAPGTGSVFMCRPTKSIGAYTQRMGRGLRPAAGVAVAGENCLIVDFIPKAARNIVLAGDVLGIARDQSEAIKKEIERREEVNADEEGVQLGFVYDGDSFDADGTPLEIITRWFDYLQQSTLAWYAPDNDEQMMTVGLGEFDGFERILVIRDGQLYGLKRVTRSRDPWRVQHLPADDVYAKADEIADQYRNGILSDRDRGWRSAPASEGQIKFARRLAKDAGRKIKITEHTPRGEAAQLITHLQAVIALTSVL